MGVNEPTRHDVEWSIEDLTNSGREKLLALMRKQKHPELGYQKQGLIAVDVEMLVVGWTEYVDDGKGGKAYTRDETKLVVPIFSHVDLRKPPTNTNPVSTRPSHIHPDQMQVEDYVDPKVIGPRTSRDPDPLP